MQRTFTLAEQFAFGSQYSWRLKDSEIRFRGAGDFERLVTRRIPASDAQVDEFFAALELIQVWEWRPDYDASDVGVSVKDGSSWSFIASDGERQCRCGGVNAHPSFADHKLTTIDRGRFALLHAALYDCFGIEGYIEVELDGPMTAAQSERISQLTAQEISAIDAALLSAARTRFRKVAMVVGTAMIELEVSIPRVPDLFYSERVRCLVEAGALESAGDLRRMRFSEVRLPADERSPSTT
jgi:hypothetical protein